MNDEPPELTWAQYVELVMGKWRQLLESDPPESAVQKFLEQQPSMVPGGNSKIGRGGNHGSEFRALFTQPELKGLGRNSTPDFMWVTRSTSLITPILIEIEKPSSRWFTKKGDFTQHLTHARGQINDWRSWFSKPDNESIFRKTYLVGDKYNSRPIKPHYLLIYGRQSEFDLSGPHDDPSALRYKRDLEPPPDLTQMTFDSLEPIYDTGDSLTIRRTATGLKLVAVSPMYETSGLHTGEEALALGDIRPVLDRTNMMSPARKNHIAERWEYWREVELKERSSQR